MKQVKSVVIPDDWVVSGGRGVTVAVIDSHVDVYDIKNIEKYYTSSNVGTYGTSHCDAVCKIISRVAPFCRIIVSQALFGKTGNHESFLRAIKNIYNEDIDVVNFSLSTSEDKGDIRSLVYDLSKRALIVAAIANNGTISYPAEYDFVTSVSSYKRDNGKSDICCEDSFIFGNESSKKTGNSMSSAFVSGIFALAKSYNKDITKEDIITQLLGR